jgi:hypothetical protein
MEVFLIRTISTGGGDGIVTFYAFTNPRQWLRGPAVVQKKQTEAKMERRAT